MSFQLRKSQIQSYLISSAPCQSRLLSVEFLRDSFTIHSYQKSITPNCEQISSVFEKNSSTEYALVQMLNTCRDHDAMKSKSTVLISMDLIKVLDRVPHDRVIKAMHDLRYDAYLLNFIASFLYNRQHFVEHRRHRSRIMSTNCRVPQGTVLGRCSSTLSTMLCSYLKLLTEACKNMLCTIPVDEHLKEIIEKIVKQ